MKKCLLTLAAVAISIAGFGQSAKSVLLNTPMRFNHPASVKEGVAAPAQKNAASQASQARHGNGSTQTSTVCNVVTLGQAANAFGAASGSRTQVSYDQNLNTVAFLHRAQCGLPAGVTNTGFYTYDISTDGGSTWAINQGPIFGAQLNQGNGCGGGTVLGPHRGRYPKGTIYNPAGNTDPALAHITYCGPWNTDFAGGTNWYGMVHGTGHVNGVRPADENYDSLTSGMMIWPDDIFVTKTGVSWILGTVNAQDATPTDMDSLAILKGTWNGADFDYVTHTFPYVINPDAALVPDLGIAFADDGMTGYIALLTNQDPTYQIYPDSTFYIQVMKTTDGGTTWSCPQDLVLAGALSQAMLVINNMDRYTTAWDLDLVVDKNNNLHIVVMIAPENGAAYSLFQGYEYKTNGIFDFYTTDQGNTWNAQLLAHPQCGYSTFGTAGVDEVSEYNRPFASRTFDGSKLYFGWFDTDTATFGIYTNQNPDLHLVGYDVDNNLWTAELSNLLAVDAGENITTGSNADGACTFGNGSYYSREGGPTPTVPVTYMVVGNSGVNTSLVTDFFYIDCASPSGTFTFQGNPLPVPTAFNSPLCVDGSGVVLGVVNNTAADLGVSANYPNPFTGKTSVDITLAKGGDVTVEISNVVGQNLSTSTYKNLSAGINTITLDASSLANGLYFYTVKAGSNVVTKTMTVE
jgi:hypothetical protein